MVVRAIKISRLRLLIFQRFKNKKHLFITYLYTMFTPGRIVFIVFFIFVFVSGLIWSYRREKKVTRIHFSKSYRVLIALLGFLTLLFVIVKIRRFL